MVGIIVTAALLSGLISFIGSSYQPAIAQQNTTGTTDATIGSGGGGGGTTSDGEGDGTTGGAAGPQVRPLKPVLRQQQRSKNNR